MNHRGLKVIPIPVSSRGWRALAGHGLSNAGLPVVVLLLAGLTFVPTMAESPTGHTNDLPLARVFLLAGQSNMQGQAVVDLDDPRDYNGGRGTLRQVLRESPTRYRMQHLVNESGDWATRDDVFVWYRTERELKCGPLGIGYSGYPGQHHFGPELQMGHVLGDAFDEPVLLIKTAWGGKSLDSDFRSPSSGGRVGPSYRNMLEQLGEAMEFATTRIPALAGHRLEIQGILWQQGWNDMVSAEATAAYPELLQHLIADLRLQLGVPELPFVYGELGNGGEDAGEAVQRFRAAQRSVAELDLPHVQFVETASFARAPEQSPNSGHGHHWFGNAESYFLIGDALGRAMVDQVLPAQEKRRVLILGDSISIGYTPTVHELLAPAALVIRPNQNGRPENCQGTDHGVKNIQRWLQLEGGDWDVIHFNFGLHDLKHVDPETGKNSMNPKHPRQSDPDEYRRQLKSIVQELMKTDAQLIFATTTPVPNGVKPLRETDAPQQYNDIARDVMRQLGTEDRPIRINDLYQFANGRLDQIQKPANVHFTREGSQQLGGEVARAIQAILDEKRK